MEPAVIKGYPRVVFAESNDPGLHPAGYQHDGPLRHLLPRTFPGGRSVRTGLAGNRRTAALLMSRAFEDMVAVADLVQRERAARDARQWDEMATYYHPESVVDVSWFLGDGAGFVEATRKNAGSANMSFHQMSPAVVTIKGERGPRRYGVCAHRNFSTRWSRRRSHRLYAAAVASSACGPALADRGAARALPQRLAAAS